MYFSLCQKEDFDCYMIIVVASRKAAKALFFKLEYENKIYTLQCITQESTLTLCWQKHYFNKRLMIDTMLLSVSPVRAKDRQEIPSGKRLQADETQ